MNNLKLIKTIEKYIIIATIVLYPLFISTSFTNLFETPKLILLFTSIVLLSIIKLIKLISSEKEVSLNVNKFDQALSIFAILYLISGIINPVNKIDILLYPANGSFVILSIIFYLFLNQFEKEDKETFFNSLLVSGFVVAIVQIISIFGITKMIPFIPEIIKTEIFTPLGNILSSILLMLVLIPSLISKLYKKVDISEKVLSTLIMVIFITNIIGSIYLLLPNKETSIKILDLKTSWSVAIDSLKVNPLFGAGPSNFGQMFNKYKTIDFNYSENWQIKYIQGSSLVLTILTEAGIIGFSVFILFLYQVLKKINLRNPDNISLLVFIIGIFTLPISFTSLPILMIILINRSDTKSVNLIKSNKKQNNLLFGLPFVLILLVISFFGYKLIYAEFIFAQSIKSVSQNKGIDAYNLINKAVQISPYTDRYHLFSSVINLTLAEALAEKENLTDEDKNNVSRLVQQSIREGKAAVAVAPYKSANWESLANMYQKLVAFAEGADTFAVESLNQAVALDPINPALRVKLGSLYYSQAKYDLAIDSFKLAILAKTDLPNAHYNLAIVYKEIKQLEKAKEEMNTTLKLLGKESADYEKALSELQNIEELTKPEVAPEPIIEPQIELPQEEVTEPQI